MCILKLSYLYQRVSTGQWNSLLSHWRWYLIWVWFAALLQGVNTYLIEIILNLSIHSQVFTHYYSLSLQEMSQAGSLMKDFNSLTFPLYFSYLAGTEEGHIHRCSCSYNEQYLDSYFGHTVRSMNKIQGYSNMYFNFLKLPTRW